MDDENRSSKEYNGTKSIEKGEIAASSHCQETGGLDWTTV
jgi:hypothetical protein